MISVLFQVDEGNGIAHHVFGELTVPLLYSLVFHQLLVGSQCLSLNLHSLSLSLGGNYLLLGLLFDLDGDVPIPIASAFRSC